jgi:hypothetical protein
MGAHPVELPAAPIPFLLTSLAGAQKRDSPVEAREHTVILNEVPQWQGGGGTVAGNASGSFSCVPPATLPRRNFVQDDRAFALFQPTFQATNQ